MARIYDDEPGGPDNSRLMVGMMGAAIFYMVWLTVFPPPAPQQQQPENIKAAEPEKASSGDNKPVEDTPPSAFQATERTPERLVETGFDDVSEKLKKVSNSVKGGYQAKISTHGARLASFDLNGYGDPNKEDEKTHDRANINLVDGPLQFTLSTRGGDVALGGTESYDVTSNSGSRIEMVRKTGEGLSVTRAYDFKDDRFGFRHTATLKNDSDKTLRVELDLVLSGFTDGPPPSFFAPGVQEFGVFCKSKEEHETFRFDDLADDGPQTVKDSVINGGVSWHYFMAAAVPSADTRIQSCTASPLMMPRSMDDASMAKLKDFQKNPESKVDDEDMIKGIALSLEHEPLTLAPGQSVVLSHDAYFGPKQLALLEHEEAGLEENIDFGIFGVLSRPLLWLLMQLFGIFGNFGIAIILLTFCVKLVTFPLNQKSYVSMQQMKVIAPEMKKLQEKYGHDRATLGQKQMELYKEKNVNPMAGCLPALIQMPVWFALYRTLWNSVELFQQPFFSWITDLSQPEMFPLIGIPILPFFVGGLWLFQTTLQPPPQDQPQMKYVMYGMPVMFTVFMFGMPSGLSVYMITNTILTMLQQLYIKKKYPTPEPEAPKEDKK